MKLSNRVLIASFAILLVLAGSVNPLILFIARRQLKILLPGRAVKISQCRFNPLGKLSFSGIQVSKGAVLEFKIKYLEVGFSFLSVVKGARSGFAQAIESCEISVDFLAVDKARITGGYLRAARNSNDGAIGCSEFKYEKLIVKDIKGKASLKNDLLQIDSLSGKILGGFFKADSLIKLNALPGYQASLNFSELDLGIFMKDFDFDEKAEVTGKVSGFLKLRADNKNILFLDGNFGSGKEGGVLTIKDARFLQNMARSSGQALDLVVESFKNYRYNTSITSIALENKNIVFLINLEGSAGKRSLNIIWHDFNSGRIK